MRITDARTALSEDIRHRQRRYAVTMGIRTLCVILAIVLWQVDRVAAVIALVCGGVLPYIAVVLANAGRERAPGPHDASITPRPPSELPESSEQTGATSQDPDDRPGQNPHEPG